MVLRGVASAAVFGQQVYSLRFPPAMSIFSAEATVIILALKFVIPSDENKLTVYSYYFSRLLAVKSCQAKKTKDR